MKKIRVLAFLLALLMVFATLAACAGGGDEGSKECPDGKHNWRKKQTVEQRRTCTTPEIRKRTCLDCGKEELVEGDPAAGHDFDETQKVYNHDATCTTDGTYMIQCTYQCTDADAIKSYPAPDSNGFTFNDYNAHDFLFKIYEALELYENTAQWDKLTLRAIKSNFTWEQSAAKYIAIYSKMLG